MADWTQILGGTGQAVGPALSTSNARLIWCRSEFYEVNLYWQYPGLRTDFQINVLTLEDFVNFEVAQLDGPTMAASGDGNVVVHNVIVAADKIWLGGLEMLGGELRPCVWSTDFPPASLSPTWTKETSGMPSNATSASVVLWNGSDIGVAFHHFNGTTWRFKVLSLDGVTTHVNVLDTDSGAFTDPEWAYSVPKPDHLTTASNFVVGRFGRDAFHALFLANADASLALDPSADPYVDFASDPEGKCQPWINASKVFMLNVDTGGTASRCAWADEGDSASDNSGGATLPDASFRGGVENFIIRGVDGQVWAWTGSQGIFAPFTTFDPCPGCSGGVEAVGFLTHFQGFQLALLSNGHAYVLGMPELAPPGAFEDEAAGFARMVRKVSDPDRVGFDSDFMALTAPERAGWEATNLQQWAGGKGSLDPDVGAAWRSEDAGRTRLLWDAGVGQTFAPKIACIVGRDSKGFRTLEGGNVTVRLFGGDTTGADTLYGVLSFSSSIGDYYGVWDGLDERRYWVLEIEEAPNVGSHPYGYFQACRAFLHGTLEQFPNNFSYGFSESSRDETQITSAGEVRRAVWGPGGKTLEATFELIGDSGFREEEFALWDQLRGDLGEDTFHLAPSVPFYFVPDPTGFLAGSGQFAPRCVWMEDCPDLKNVPEAENPLYTATLKLHQV